MLSDDRNQLFVFDLKERLAQNLIAYPHDVPRLHFQSRECEICAS